MGFSIKVLSSKHLFGLRELSSTSSIAIGAILKLNKIFEEAPERKQGLVPVVSCTCVTSVKSRMGINYEPTLKIDRWVPRPDALQAAVVATPAAATNGPATPDVEEDFSTSGDSVEY